MVYNQIHDSSFRSDIKTNFEIRETNFEIREANFEIRETNFEIRETNFEIREADFLVNFTEHAIYVLHMQIDSVTFAKR